MFQNGPIYWSAATGAHPIVNHFHQKWGTYGFEGGWLGYPKTDEIVLNGGRRQEFQGAGMYWSPLTGAHTLGGAIRDKFNVLGAESALGYPTTDEIWLTKYNGRFNDFQRGAIYWSSVTNAHFVDFDVLKPFRARGSEAGFHGYPTTDTIRDTLFAGWLTQNFETNNIRAYRPF